MDIEMVVSWVVVGLAAGWLTRLAMNGGGYGLTGDLVLGLLGSVVSGGIVSALSLTVSDRIFAMMFVVFFGAVVVIVAQRAFWPKPRLRT